MLEEEMETFEYIDEIYGAATELQSLANQIKETMDKMGLHLMHGRKEEFEELKRELTRTIKRVNSSNIFDKLIENLSKYRVEEK